MSTTTPKEERLALLHEKVDATADDGLAKCGAHASMHDRVFYAAKILFPDAGEEAWGLLADFVMNEVEEL